MNCLFCDIVSGQLAADIVYNDERIIGFPDHRPQAPHHILFVPKQHIATVNELDHSTASLVGHLVTAAVSVAKQKGFAEAGYRLVMNCNPQGGQTVFHIHLHLLCGRQMHWPPG